MQEAIQLRPISKGKIDSLPLNLFGEAGEVFRLGFDRIADVIRNAANLQKIKDVRAAIHPEWMNRWGTRPRLLESRAARAVAPMLSFLMIASLVYYWGFYGSGWFVVAAFSFGGAFALHYRSRVREVTDSVADPVKDLQIFSLLLARLEKEQWKTQKLVELRAALNTQGRPPSKEIRKLVLMIEWLNSRLNPAFAAIGAPLLLWGTQFAFAIGNRAEPCGALLRDFNGIRFCFLTLGSLILD